MQRLLIGSNNICEVRGLRDSDGVIEDATVNVTIYDGASNPVEGQLWPVTLSHVANGTYRGTLDFDMELRNGGNYFARVNATDTGGRQRQWEIQLKAEKDKVY